MDCREFRNKHVGFVDDVLSAAEMDAMQAHLSRCPRCSRQDTAVRRSLLLVRNLPPIEPSADFAIRLNARIAALGSVPRTAQVSSRSALSTTGVFIAVAAGIAIVAVMSIETTRYFAPAESVTSAVADQGIVLPANSIDSLSAAPVAAPIANAALVASVPTGMPVWPAVLMLGDAPARFANMEFHQADLTR